MKKNNKFFNRQNNSTAVKLKFLEAYIEGYLMKVLMQFGRCFVADLFCGTGKNGEKNGSPLILIEKIKKIIQNPVLREKHNNPEVILFFNDIDEKNIENLKGELKSLDIPPGIRIIEPQNKKFSEILKDEDIKEWLSINNIPKFFFLDPFSYSDIGKTEQIKELMDFCFSEVLFFIPTFHFYRFRIGKKVADKNVDFSKEFTCGDIEKWKNIYDCNESIRKKLSRELDLKFVRPIPIDAGKSKHTLFLLTKHPLGMFLINRLFLKNSYDGKSLCVADIKRYEKENMLFDKKIIETVSFVKEVKKFQKKLIEMLKTKKSVKNTEIIEFIAQNGFIPKYATEALTKLLKDGKIKIDYFVEKPKNSCFYISEKNWDKEFCLISYK